MDFGYNEMSKKGMDADAIKHLLKQVESLHLEKYYKYRGAESVRIKDLDEIKDLVNNPMDIRYNTEKQFFEYLVPGSDANSGGTWNEITVDYSTNFTESNRWVSSRLPDHTRVFNNYTLEAVSDEQESFYISLIIAGVFGESLKDEFFDILEEYDFENWLGKNGEGSWTNFVSEAVEIGSFNIKMLVSACRYKVQTEKNDIFSYVNSGLPQVTVLKLEQLKNDLKKIRMDFELTELSPTVKATRSRLEIKVLNRQLEVQLNARLIQDPDVYQLWKLFKINSENVDATVKFSLKRAARKNYEECAKNSELFKVSGRDEASFREVYIEYAYRELLRAFIAKLRAEEIEKFKNCIATGAEYIAPKRV